MTTVLVVGSGGREHALAWKLCRSPELSHLYVAPGNAGTAAIAENVPIAATDVAGLTRFVTERSVGLTVVGPEAPLALGLADRLEEAGCAVVGPRAAAARIEWSKAFAKDLMRRAGVPTAGYRVCDDAQSAFRYLQEARYPLAVKADGLAGGKGVVLCADIAEARAAIESIMVAGAHGPAGERVVIEEGLKGPEISLLALVDGRRAIALPLTQDHKRLGDGDTGPNTGGMGAYAPVPWFDETQRDELVALAIEPVVRLLAELGTPYRGVLYAGVMLTKDGPRVLEYNCRLGDPEAQVILPVLEGDILPWLEAVARGDLPGVPPAIHAAGAAVGVVLAAPGYPDSPRVGTPIDGLKDIPEGVLVFHAGTVLDAATRDRRVVTSGGRVLTVVGLDTTVEAAAARAYAAPVRFEGMQLRSDIGRPKSRRLKACLGTAEGPVPDMDADYPVEANDDLEALKNGRDHGSSRPRSGNGSGPRDAAARRIVVLASGDGSNAQALLDACAGGDVNAEIVAVVSHNPVARALERARAAGVPAIALPLADRRDPACRRQLEESLLTLLASLQPNLVVLAGWMLILSAGFLERCPCPLINVHPALLPPGGRGETVAIAGIAALPVLRGAHAVRAAVELGLPVTGVSVHHVTPEVDAGPVVLSQIVPIHAGEDEAALYRRIKPVEHHLLRQAVQLILDSGGAHA
ncbi:MAG TPA: phosphoribosylamine--glycine ligase [Chloroflexota bacterium]|nr:phosphoribosylamine--glycine ligase [Chloroflexota bacterium]